VEQWDNQIIERVDMMESEKKDEREIRKEDEWDEG